MPGIFPIQTKKMTFVEIKKVFEKRKFNLIRTLEHGKEDIDLSKQHQIFGAIRELENIIKIIDHYQETETENNIDFRLSNEPDKTLIQKITLKLKNIKPEDKTIILNE
ncbi:hypothetical protein ACFLTH_13490 [Bacteroidota bacterium]